VLNSDYKDMLHVLLDHGVEFLTTISGVGFREAHEQSKIVEIDGLPIPVLSLGDLIRNKRATGREKDRLDADKLERGRP